MAGGIEAFTKQMMDSILLASKPMGSGPYLTLASPYFKSVFVVSNSAISEAWDWRRTKRELRRIGLVRKGVRREFHKVAA
jgi:hypothetical protein